MDKLSNKQFIKRTREVKERGYVPNEKVLEAIGAVKLVTVTGPSFSGKDTLRRKLALPLVISDTIREPRENSGKLEVNGVEYYFKGNKLAKVWKSVEAGNYVQFGMGPNQQGFYGSHSKRYPESGLAVIDVMSDQLETMRTLPFKQLFSCYIVPPSFEAWEARRDRRGQLSEEELADRNNEAAASLQCASQDENLVFIINHDIRRTVHEVRQFVYEGKVDQARQTEAREIGQDMLGRLALAA